MKQQRKIFMFHMKIIVILRMLETLGIGLKKKQFKPGTGGPTMSKVEEMKEEFFENYCRFDISGLSPKHNAQMRADLQAIIDEVRKEKEAENIIMPPMFTP